MLINLISTFLYYIAVILNIMITICFVSYILRMLIMTGAARNDIVIALHEAISKIADPILGFVENLLSPQYKPLAFLILIGVSLLYRMIIYPTLLEVLTWFY